jgi:hypothetical protein
MVNGSASLLASWPVEARPRVPQQVAASTYLFGFHSIMAERTTYG